jgi:SAM-dependent methyltransferase
VGLNFYTAREVLRCREAAPLGSIATIGRLQQFLLQPQAAALAARYDLPLGSWSRQPYGGYAEPFFEAAGATSVSSIDATAYEGADIVHDMNGRIGADLAQRFDLVIDGGSIEHIFRPDRALENVIRMTSIGGHILIWAPANNQCGHGFFQFSPEFFFSAISEGSGCSIERTLLVECVYPSVSLVSPKRAYLVRSPEEIGERVGALSRRPLMLLVHARKHSHVGQPFRAVPQQSDYVAQWAERSSGPVSPVAKLVSGSSRLAGRYRFGETLVHHVRGALERRRFSLRNRRFFEPEDD